MRILKWLDAWFEQTILVLLCAILVASLSYSAFVRYFITDPFFTGLSHKAEELAIFAFVFFGSFFINNTSIVLIMIPVVIALAQWGGTQVKRTRTSR